MKTLQDGKLRPLSAAPHFEIAAFSNFGVSAELVVACRACAACDRFGFVRNSAATAFDVFYWFQVTKFQITNFTLPNSAPNRADYIDVWGLGLHWQLFRSNVRFRSSTDITRKCLKRQALFEILR